jgi:hypothetical protein
MTQNSNISQGLRNLAVGFLGTTVALTVGLPQQAQAQTLVGGSYAYAYQEITNLRIVPNPQFVIGIQPNTSAGAQVSSPLPTPPGEIANPFDVQESFASSSQTSGINQGLGNNTGFFTDSALNSDKGPVDPDYTRSDAWLAQNNSGTPQTIESTAQLVSLLFSTDANSGVDAASVAESYV